MKFFCNFPLSVGWKKALESGGFAAAESNEDADVVLSAADDSVDASTPVVEWLGGASGAGFDWPLPVGSTLSGGFFGGEDGPWRAYHAVFLHERGAAPSAATAADLDAAILEQLRDLLTRLDFGAQPHRRLRVRVSGPSAGAAFALLAPAASAPAALSAAIAKRAQHSTVRAIRCLAADMVRKANSGHPGAPMGMAPAAFVLWRNHLVADAADPDWAARDRFVLSNGHACALLYSMLHLAGSSALTLDQLKAFRTLGSLTPGHPEARHTPGVDATTGPLGQGIATAVGFALAQQHAHARFGGALGRTFVFLGDGCLQEGIGLEAISLAGRLGLGNLVAVWDDNRITIDGETHLSTVQDIPATFRACGWDAAAVASGDWDLAAIDAALRAATAHTAPAAPHLIALRTVIGFGSKEENTHKVHGSPLAPDDIAAFKAACGVLEPAAPFASYLTPREYASVAAPLAARARARRAAPGAQLPAQGDEWRGALPQFKAGESLATRVASGKCLEALAKAMPLLVGGSADLTPSNNTAVFGSGAMKLGSFAERYIHFGVREHAMVAVTNGMCLFGLRAFCATFLNFAGYAMGALRVAALSQSPTLFIGTHDSIGLGEDGPTHQPVETLAALRAMPNMLVLRPADARETAGAYLAALSHATGPAVLALTRQNITTLETTSAEKVLRGAYVVHAEQGALECVVMATGSEVALAVGAVKGVGGVRVVSAPSWELFEKQTEEYRREVLPKGVPVVSVEAASKFGWERYAQYHVAMETFGASCPAPDAFKHFGFTAENIVRVVETAKKNGKM